MTGRRAVLTVTAIAAVVFATTACSSAGGEPDLSIVLGGNGTDTDDAWRDVVAGFEAANPDIEVELEFFNTNDYDQLLKTRLSGGAGPDVYWLDLGNIADFIEDGFAADLEGVGSDYLDRLTPDAREDSERYSPDGGAYNVPIGLSTNGILYNVELFEAAGITQAPTTYTDFLAACEKLLDSGVTPIAMSAQDNWWPQFIIYYALAQHGANEALGEAMLAGEADFSSREAWVRSMEIVRELTPYYLPNPLGTSQTAAQQAFLSGEAAMFPQSVLLDDARAADIDVGFMDFPTVDTQVPFQWGAYAPRLGVNPGNDRTDNAHRFIEYFLTDEVYKPWLERANVFPTTTTVELGAEVDPLYPVMQSGWEGREFVDLFSPASTDMQTQLLVAMQNVISGERTPREALEDLDGALERFRAANT